MPLSPAKPRKHLCPSEPEKVLIVCFDLPSGERSFLEEEVEIVRGKRAQILLLSPTRCKNKFHCAGKKFPSARKKPTPRRNLLPAPRNSITSPPNTVTPRRNLLPVTRNPLPVTRNALPLPRNALTSPRNAITLPRTALTPHPSATLTMNWWPRGG